jgi:pre-mRNA-splicing factor 18
MKQLRDRNEPIRLFGESDEARLKRLQYIKTHESEEVGLRNDLMLAEDEAQQKFLDEILNLSGQDPQQLAKEKEKKRKEVKMVIDLTKGELLELIGKAGKNDYFINQEFTLKFVQYILLLWGSDLESSRESSSYEKKQKSEKTEVDELAKYNQTKAYLQPLMEKLQLRTLDEDMAFFFSQIVTCCLKREYIEADELYMKLSIGNAAWPIGVTMVGIHARTGREKIFSGKVAHVLNDEEQRKYIQAFKRLVTFCAKKFPTDPSKMLHSLHVSSL